MDERVSKQTSERVSERMSSRGGARERVNGAIKRVSGRAYGQVPMKWNNIMPLQFAKKIKRMRAFGTLTVLILGLLKPPCWTTADVFLADFPFSVIFFEYGQILYFAFCHRSYGSFF